MTSDSDYLEHQLRENLRLRRELAAEVAKAKEGGGIAYRLGWVLYWICLTFAGGIAILFLLWVISDPSVAEDIRQSPSLLLLIALSCLILYGLGRAFRYVLSAE